MPIYSRPVSPVGQLPHDHPVTPGEAMFWFASVIPEGESPTLEQLYHQVSRLESELNRALSSIHAEEQSNHSFKSNSSSRNRQTKRKAKQKQRRRRDTPQVPRVILTPPTCGNSTNNPSSGQSIWLSKVQSFKKS